MRFHGKVLHPKFTDLLVMVGAHVRNLEHDYEDLRKAHPEVFTGYRVRLMTVEEIAHGRLRGVSVMKFIVTEGSQDAREWRAAWADIHGLLEYYPWSGLEYWHVHRGRGIWKIHEWRSVQRTLDSTPAKTRG